MDSIKNKVNQYKQKVSEYFLLRSSNETLSKTATRFCVSSIGLDDIYYGIKHPKRFKLCIFICILMWLTTFWHISFITENHLFKLIYSPFLPDHAKTFFSVVVIILILVCVIKTDIIFGEMKNNLEPLKIYQGLEVNDKSIHRLTDKNYKRIQILTRIIIIIFINCAAQFFIIFSLLLLLYFAILSQRLYWWIHFLFICPIYINMIYTLFVAACVNYLYFPYFKLRFDQFNHQIKQIQNTRSKIIFPNRENLLIKLINEHNSLAVEVNKFNLLFRKTAAGMFVCFSLSKITTIYLSIYMKHTFARILMITAFSYFFLFGFGITCIYSLQINSSKSSYKMFHSIVCRSKMKLQLRLKVN